jgi:predicted enzyme related to lactoylglutathione lyase
MAARVVHFEILSENPERVAQFYQEALGWEIQTWPGGQQAYWLVTTGAEGSPGINGGIMHRHFPQAVINTTQVDSLADTLARIERAGGKKVSGPNEIPGIGTHAYCTDPDGNLFGVLQPAPAS